MLKDDFLKNVEEDEVLEIKEERGDSIVVLNNKMKGKYKVMFDSIESNDWGNLKDVLYGRDAVVMDGITRIVGYFSKVSNWNQSKLGELEDRRTGDYRVKCDS